MNRQNTIHLVRCLNRVTEKYTLSKHELDLLSKIDCNLITSISFTTDGGFDKLNGDFYDEVRETNYKIRIKYKLKDTSAEKTLVIMPD